MNGVVPGRDKHGALLADPPAGLLAELREVIMAVRPDADLGLIERAYEVAAAWHHGQLRRSGDPYITHPVAVAMILARLGADDQMLCAALLHDTVEDTPYTSAELNRDFGAGIADLVAGVVALDQIKYGRARTLHQAIAAAQSAAPRVLVVKLADRLHNMRTLEFVSQGKQLRKAKEALEFFVPVAARLSLRTIESELETLASATFRRHQHVSSASGRLLTAMTALLPGRAQTRWREEWMGELHTLPTRRARARFAVHTVLGVPRLAVTLRRPGLPGGPVTRTLSAAQPARTRTASMPRHRVIVALDIEHSTSRPDLVKAELRRTLYELFGRALRSAGIRAAHHDPFIDRGDGLLALIHPVDQVPKAVLLNRVVPELARLLADHNAGLPRTARPQGQLRIRAVVHAGEVHYDGKGVFGEALDIAFRLLDAPGVKKALRAAADPLTLVISGDIYRSVVRHGYEGIDQHAFHPLVRVLVAGQRYPGWVHIPPQAAPLRLAELASYRQRVG